MAQQPDQQQSATVVAVPVVFAENDSHLNTIHHSDTANDYIAAITTTTTTTATTTTTNNKTSTRTEEIIDNNKAKATTSGASTTTTTTATGSTPLVENSSASSMILDVSASASASTTKTLPQPVLLSLSSSSSSSSSVVLLQQQQQPPPPPLLPQRQPPPSSEEEEESVAEIGGYLSEVSTNTSCCMEQPLTTSTTTTTATSTTATATSTTATATIAVGKTAPITKTTTMTTTNQLIVRTNSQSPLSPKQQPQHQRLHHHAHPQHQYHRILPPPPPPPPQHLVDDDNDRNVVDNNNHDDNNSIINHHHHHQMDNDIDIDDMDIDVDDDDHCPNRLPKFPDVQSCMWTASWAANSPTEDRSASLVNLLLQPLPPNYDSETQLAPLEPDYKTLIRLNLWAVIDGHGGGSVATYSSEVLLPHIAASIARALRCVIVDRGVCMVNGQLRDANALDLDGLIKTSDRCHGSNPNSIHYRSPYERSGDSDDGNYGGGDDDDDVATTLQHPIRERKQMASSNNQTNQLGKNKIEMEADASVSSVKTSVKTTTSLVNRDELIGTHSPREVASITRALTESFLAVDEGWINSIDPVATQQTSCQSNGRWNSGACALVVFTVQRLDWTNVAEPEREKDVRGLDTNRLNTSQNRDAARRRMLDYARRSKSASSVSTTSSTSSLTTEEVNASGIESEITETEGEEERFLVADVRKRVPIHEKMPVARRKKKALINPSSKSSTYCYKAHTAMIYTAHVGDCRAVMLGSAPPRTIKVAGGGALLSAPSVSASHQDTTDDEESSHHSSDETECLSSSDHDADSSEDEDIGSNGGGVALTGSGCIPISTATTATVTTSTTTASTATSATTTTPPSTSAFIKLPRRVVRQRNRAPEDSNGPYIALPPLYVSEESKAKVDIEIGTELEQRGDNRTKASGDSSTDSQESIDYIPLVQLPPGTSPIDLTTDHSAYNPAEVTAVLRRCNNAPRAISAGVGGGIKRVAGSLAVTRALGDAYLKTPLLSFVPYKNFAPYISARPEVNCRPLNNDGDKVLICATDGVWERASGEDVLRWVRNFYEERVAEAERRKRRTLNHIDKSQSSDDDDDDSFEPVPVNKNFPQEGSERDLFEKNEEDIATSTNPRKRELPNTNGPPGALNAASTTATKRRKRNHHQRRNDGGIGGVSYNVADVIIRRVLNKVRRSRNISSLQALMSLPQGRARRSKHDDITASVVDLSAYVS